MLEVLLVETNEAGIKTERTENVDADRQVLKGSMMVFMKGDTIAKKIPIAKIKDMRQVSDVEPVNKMPSKGKSE